MEIKLSIADNLYDCSMIIEDANGRQNHILSGENSEVRVFVSDGDFKLTLIPIMVDYKSVMKDAQPVTLKEMLAGKAAGFMLSAFDNMLLRVGCSYNITGANNGDIITIKQAQYAHTSFDKLDLFDLIPVAYMFFEVYCGNRRFKLLDTFEINRKNVISSARTLALLDFGLNLIITYPVQVSRVKRLTSARKIRKTLLRFNKMSEDKRAELLQKQEKFYS